MDRPNKTSDISDPSSASDSNEGKKLSLDAPPSSPSRVTRFVFPAILIYVLVGINYDPHWWDGFLFQGGILDSSKWNEGLSFVIENFLFQSLVVFIVIIAICWLVRRRWPRQFAHFWTVVKTNMYGSKGFYLQLVLLVGVGASLVSMHSNIEAEGKKYLDTLIVQTTKEAPLARPTSFVFLSKDNIESLYGQYEPELNRSTVIEEMQNAKDVRAGANVDEFLKTEIGKSELQRRLTEYHQNPKNTERKLGDLLKFLLTSNYVKRYANLESKSTEIQKLDGATALLKSEYNLIVDPKQVTQVRDKLLAEEILRLVNELKELHGLALIEGDWSVETQPDAYILKRPFVENVTDSPVCETKVPKSDISAQNREIIEGLKGERMRLSVFGNVITGMAGSSRTVRVNPMAVF